jgi:myosin heavy subunit
MKKLSWVILTLLLFGCQQKQQQIDRLSALRDSLAQVSSEKDSAIVEFLTGFNEIQANLDSIKTAEKLVTLSAVQPGELGSNQKKQILEDIALLNQLIQKNKDLTASLQKKLNNANSKIGQLQGMISEFEKMVENLNARIEEKDAEIAQLTTEVQRLNIDISQLTEQVQKITQESQEKSQTIESQVRELNKAFYAIGTAKELTDNNILEKSGGVLGMGRTMKMKKDFNREYFSEVDIRHFTVLPLMVKKARVISVHPATSFHITGEKTADTLFIDNPEEFWKASKYLLLVVD